MRNLEDFKKSFSNILGMEVEEETAKMIEETVNTAVLDYEEANKLLTDNGTFWGRRKLYRERLKRRLLEKAIHGRLYGCNGRN